MKIYYRLRNKIFRGFKHWTIRKTILTVVVLLLLVLIGTKSLHYIELRHWDNRLGELYEPLIPATYIPNITNLLTPWRYLMPSDLPSYRLEISAADRRTLAAAIPSGFAAELPDDATWVPGTFHAEGRTYKVKVRYRGLLPSHWKYRQKSIRVRFTKELFHGYEELNFIIPEEKNFLVEEYGYHVAEKLGLVTVDSSFIRLKVSGQSTGVYWLVEQWGPGFLERHQLSADANFYSGETGGIFDDAASWDVNATEPRWADHNYADLDLLISCLNTCSDEAFYATARRLIDLENFARWQAHATIMGDDHQDYFHNNRFYFDPTRGQFMFFPWDTSQFKFNGAIDIYFNPLMSRLSTIPEIRHRRNQLVWEYVNNEQTVADDLKYYQTLWQSTQSAFYCDRTKRVSNWFVKNQVEQRLALITGQYRYLRDVLAGTNEAPTAIKLNLRAGQPISLGIVLNQFSDLKLRGLTIKGNLAGGRLVFDSNQNGTVDQTDRTLSAFIADGDTFSAKDFELLLSTKRQIPLKIELPLGLVPTTYQFFIVGAAPALQPSDITVDLRQAVTDQPVSTVVQLYDTTSFQYLEDIDRPLDQFLGQNPLFQRTKGTELFIAAGEHRLTQTVVIPRGTKLTIAAGATLRLDAGVSLISYSPIDAAGTAEQPIIFESSGGQSWGVVAVVEGGSAIFRYCRLSHGKDALINGAYFSGMLSTYHTDLTMERCTIEGAQADDGVNVKFARANITGSVFQRQSADALDLDFVTGTIAGNLFLDNGNDGVDISGSEALRIENNVMRGSGDKGISIGENSRPMIVNNIMINGNIGIEVKDLSEPIIGNVTIVGNKVGLNAYRKKEIFGGGIGRVYNSVIWNNEVELEHDEYSRLEVQSSVVQGGWPASFAKRGEQGIGIVDIDPQFADADQFNFTVTNSALGPTFDSAAAGQYGLSGYATLGADTTRLPSL